MAIRGFRTGPTPDATERGVFFTAFGRDVNQAEARLGFDPTTRRLSVIGGSRGHVKADAAEPDVLEALGHGQVLSQRGVERAVGPAHSKEAIRGALAHLVATGE